MRMITEKHLMLIYRSGYVFDRWSDIDDHRAIIRGINKTIQRMETGDTIEEIELEILIKAEESLITDAEWFIDEEVGKMVYKPYRKPPPPSGPCIFILVNTAQYGFGGLWIGQSDDLFQTTKSIYKNPNGTKSFQIFACAKHPNKFDLYQALLEKFSDDEFRFGVLPFIPNAARIDMEPVMKWLNDFDVQKSLGIKR